MSKKLILIVLLIGCLPAYASATVAEGWVRHVIGPQTSPIYLYTADMDGDGVLDVVTTSNVHPSIYNSEVAWFKNNLKKDGTWKKVIIASNAPGSDFTTNANGVVVADLDNDGRLDVIVGTGRVTTQEGTVYWFKAPANPEQENWQRFQVDPATDSSFFKVYTLDVNSDGYQDIIAGTNHGTYVYMNRGKPAQDGAQWEKILLAEGSGSSNYLEDMDKDGKPDILNSHLGTKEDDYHGNVSWFDNTAAGLPFQRNMIDDNVFKAFDVNAMDANGDGRMDVIVSIFKTAGIYWFEQPAAGSTSWAKHAVSETFEGTDMYTGDINGDRKKELIISGLFTKKISWFQATTGSEGELWTENVLDDAINTPGDISLDDLDGDGDLDVVLAGMGENQIIWYENQLPRPNPCALTFVLGEKSSALPALKSFRDNYLKSMPGGESIIKSYYSASPGIIQFLQSIKGVTTKLLP
jgi:hypothetical protein